MDPNAFTDDPGTETGDSYLDTVALLQEEIGRLEAELRSRDDVPIPTVPAPDDLRDEDGAARHVDELTALLAERDETIDLLWEQLSAMEESQAARSAEWDQLHRWVEELEARFAVEGGTPAVPDEGRREAEALRDQMEARRRAWDEQRRRLEEEIAGLRARLDDAIGGEGSPDLAAMEQENRRLRDECRRLGGFEAEAATLADEVAGLHAELELARQQLQQMHDERDTDRLRHQEELSGGQSGQAPGRLSGSELAPHERIRAFREHLREMQLRDEQERQQRQQHQLSSRIARLWQRPGARR